MISLICRTQNMIQMNLFTIQKQTHRQKTNMTAKWESREGMNQEFGLADTNYYI